MARDRIVNWTLALAASLLTLAAAEGAGRFWEWRHPPRPVADYLWDWQQRWEGDFYVFESDAVGWPPWEAFNADGVRDRTHAVEKPEGVQRLVFLGDSVTLGDGIEPAQAYPQQLAARFENEGRPVEVFNVALLGWSTRQERIAYRRIVRRYRPDDVVLAVCLNDIPELQNNLTRPGPVLAALHRRSALVRALVRAPAREIASVEELFERHDSAKVRAAMERFFGEIRALRGEVEADGARLSVIVFPFRFQVLPGAPAPVVQEEIRVFAERERLPFRDLQPVIAELGERAFVDYDHLSPAGARRVAQDLAERSPFPLPPSGPETLKAVGLDADAADGELRRALGTHEDAGVRAAAAWALGRRTGTDPAIDDALAAAVRSETSEHVRAGGAAALGRRRAVAAAPTLFAALGDRRASVRWAAAGALAHLPLVPGTTVPGLVAAMRSEDPYVRGFATWSLGALGAEAAPAVPDLVRGLAEEDAFSRGGAAAALGKLGPVAEPAVPALIGVLESGDLDRRRKAARVLGRIGTSARGALPALLRAVRDDHEYVRAQAVRALGRIDPARPEVVEALRAALSDRDADVRRQAELAIRGRGQSVADDRD